MHNTLVFTVGFTAQALFSARLLVQWIKSEKVKRVLTPEIFWELSLAASFLMFVYGCMRDDFAIMLGQSITYFIYIRNMQLQRRWKKIPKFFRSFLLLFPLLASFYGYNNGVIDSEGLFANHHIPLWLLIWGSLAQLIFTFRFLYQWILSDTRKTSHLPMGFWILSLTGSCMILLYALLRKDPVLFLGHYMGVAIYTRNVRELMRQTRKNKKTLRP